MRIFTIAIQCTRMHIHMYFFNWNSHCLGTVCNMLKITTCILKFTDDVIFIAFHHHRIELCWIVVNVLLSGSMLLPMSVLVCRNLMYFSQYTRIYIHTCMHFRACACVYSRALQCLVSILQCCGLFPP